MNILKEVNKRLRKEFPLIRPDIVDAVVWMISGGMEKKSFAQVSDEIVGKDKKFVNPKKREQLVYEVILELGRRRCCNEEILTSLKMIISEAVAQGSTKPSNKVEIKSPIVKTKKTVAQSEFFSAATLIVKKKEEKKKIEYPLKVGVKSKGSKRSLDEKPAADFRESRKSPRFAH